jgi:hypothetical protein
MPETNFRALCAELLAALKSWSPHGGGPLECWEDREEEAALIARAEALLDQPEPAPTDEELLKLLSRVSGLLDNDTYIVDGGRIMSEPNELLAFAHAVLARWGNA